MTLSLTTLPTEFNEGIYTKTQQASALAKVFNARPQLFSNQAYHVLSASPKAQFVGAGDAKKGTDAVLETVTVAPLKAQVTMRFDEEVKWADEDHQMGVLNELADQGAIALSRALDLGAIHGISPLEGTRYPAIRHAAVDSTLSIELEANKADAAMRAGYGLMLSADNGKGYTPSAMVFDPRMTYEIASQTNPQSGQPLHPELGFGDSMTSYMGMPVGVSNTVSGVAELSTGDSHLRGLMLAQNNFVWGIQKDLGLRMFEYGDPDNTGKDLAGHNQIALRLEMVFSFAFIDLNGVVKLVDNVA